MVLNDQTAVFRGGGGKNETSNLVTTARSETIWNRCTTAAVTASKQHAARRSLTDAVLTLTGPRQSFLFWRPSEDRSGASSLAANLEPLACIYIITPHANGCSSAEAAQASLLLEKHGLDTSRPRKQWAIPEDTCLYNQLLLQTVYPSTPIDAADRFNVAA